MISNVVNIAREVVLYINESKYSERAVKISEIYSPTSHPKYLISDFVLWNTQDENHKKN